MFEQYQLKNKANVIFVPQKDTRSVTVMVMYPVGSRYESDKMAGVSHYIEHLMFKGTTKRKTTQILTREIDRLGAEYNAFTSKENTGYYIKVDSAYTKIALDILSDMLFHSLFDPKEMEREKGPIVEELRMYRDNPMMNIDNVFEDLMYAGCPVGRDIGGTPETVMSFKRNDVLAFKKKYYTASNMTIVVAGNVDEATKKLVQEFFGEEKNTGVPSHEYLPAVYGPNNKEKRLVIQKKETDQVQLMLGFPGFQYGAKENPAVTVMNTIFGGSTSSRLFIQIRERRGLAYVVSSGSDQFRDTGHAYVRMGLEAKNINKALSVVKQEIEKLVTKGVTARELADAKTHIHGGMALSLEDSSTQASWYAKEALFDTKIKTPEERMSEINAVTREDVQVVAKKIFRLKEARVAIIGDVKKDIELF